MRRFLHTRAVLFTKLIPLRDTPHQLNVDTKSQQGTERGIEHTGSPLVVIFIVIARRLREPSPKSNYESGTVLNKFQFSITSM